MNLLATIGDPDGTRTVTAIVALLVAMGIALFMVAIWLRRTTRPDPELLAPLEVMGERKWRRADPVGQRRTLDQVRPEGAEPLEPSSAPPSLDKAFDAGPPAAGFDDLRGDEGDEPGSDDPGIATPAHMSMEFLAATAEVTPRQIERLDVDEFSEDIDADLLAAAAEELDAELRRPPTDG